MKSVIKTWFRRNGFAPEHGPWRECRGYMTRSGRRFRVRGDLVDISEPYAQFDRWANSREATMPLCIFMVEYARKK
jgi:hypothetical protein